MCWSIWIIPIKDSEELLSRCCWRHKTCTKQVWRHKSDPLKGSFYWNDGCVNTQALGWKNKAVGRRVFGFKWNGFWSYFLDGPWWITGLFASQLPFLSTVSYIFVFYLLVWQICHYIHMGLWCGWWDKSLRYTGNKPLMFSHKPLMLSMRIVEAAAASDL